MRVPVKGNGRQLFPFGVWLCIYGIRQGRDGIRGRPAVAGCVSPVEEWMWLRERRRGYDSFWRCDKRGVRGGRQGLHVKE